MLKNYIIIAWRNLLRSKVFSTINILGLAIGWVVTLSIIQYARFEFSYEDTHEKADQIVRVSMEYLDNEIVTYEDAACYGPAGKRIVADLPEAIESTFISPVDPITFQAGEAFHKETKVSLSNNQFFELFTYTPLEGRKEEFLINPFEVVLTQSVAEKYFPGQPALHRTLTYRHYDNKTYSFKVVGVIPDSPANSHMNFDILVSFKSTGTLWQYREHNWDQNNEYTYVLLNDVKSIETFNSKLAELNTILWSEGKILNERMVAQPLNDIHLFSHKGYELEPPGSATFVYFLLGIAFFVIIIAWVNYINLSTAKAMDRAKEVGIRKVVGSNRAQLRWQFLTEAGLSNMVACLLGVSLTQLSLPLFKSVTMLPGDFSFSVDLIFIGIVIGILIFGTLISGFYPALVLSSFEPISVLKGRFTSSGKGINQRRILVIAQFSLTILLLTGTFTIREQINFLKSMELGMNLAHKLVIEAPSASDRIRGKAFRNELVQNPAIESVSFSEAVPGSEEMLSSTSGVWIEGASAHNNYNFYTYRIDHDYFDQFGMKILAGNNFQKDITQEGDLILNEETIRLWGIPNAEEVIRKKVDLWGKKRTIIGVVGNFHQLSAKSPYLPLIFMYNDVVDGGPWTYTIVEVGPNASKEQVDIVKEMFTEFFPNSVFRYYVMDERYDLQFRSDEQFHSSFSIMTFIAILISAMGLFGLVTFTVSSRTKEIGIRKVLGAEVGQIIYLLSSGFIKLIVISMICSIPVTYYAINIWLNNYSSRIDISWWLFAVPIVLIFLIALISVTGESLKAATRNPIDALRYE